MSRHPVETALRNDSSLVSQELHSREAKLEEKVTILSNLFYKENYTWLFGDRGHKL